MKGEGVRHDNYDASKATADGVVAAYASFGLEMPDSITKRDPARTADLMHNLGLMLEYFRHHRAAHLATVAYAVIFHYEMRPNEQWLDREQQQWASRETARTLATRVRKAAA